MVNAGRSLRTAGGEKQLGVAKCRFSVDLVFFSMAQVFVNFLPSVRRAFV